MDDGRRGLLILAYRKPSLNLPFFFQFFKSDLGSPILFFFTSTLLGSFTFLYDHYDIITISFCRSIRYLAVPRLDRNSHEFRIRTTQRVAPRFFRYQGAQFLELSFVPVVEIELVQILRPLLNLLFSLKILTD